MSGKRNCEEYLLQTFLVDDDDDGSGIDGNNIGIDAGGEREGRGQEAGSGLKDGGGGRGGPTITTTTKTRSIVENSSLLPVEGR